MSAADVLCSLTSGEIALSLICPREFITIGCLQFLFLFLLLFLRSYVLWECDPSFGDGLLLTVSLILLLLTFFVHIFCSTYMSTMCVRILSVLLLLQSPKKKGKKQT